MMRVAIQPGSGFDQHWIKYCVENHIEYKIVDVYSNDVIEQLKDCDAFAWHHYQASCKDVQFAKQLLYSVEMMGIKVFPDFFTTWHFDDKVGQKYLLEAVGAPIVPTYVFYTREEANRWASNTSYPIVAKLRRGAGSANVKLLKNKSEALRWIQRSFTIGFPQYDKWGNIKERWRKYKLGKCTFLSILKGFGRLFIIPRFAKMVGKEKGYVYFQNFIPGNTFDIRIIVIDGKAFGIKRVVRKGDFRASGSGQIIYEKRQIDERCVQISFDIAKKIKSQSVAFDYVFDSNNVPLIVEISYGFAPEGYVNCEGYWLEDLSFHSEPFNPYGWMIEGLRKK